MKQTRRNSEIPSQSPLRNIMWVWMNWLQELGGDYVPLLPEPSQKRTGRRDPDIKPRTYSLKDRIYDTKDKRGIIVRWDTKFVKWGLRPE